MNKSIKRIIPLLTSLALLNINVCAIPTSVKINDATKKRLLGSVGGLGVIGLARAVKTSGKTSNAKDKSKVENNNKTQVVNTKPSDDSTVSYYKPNTYDYNCFPSTTYFTYTNTKTTPSTLNKDVPNELKYSNKISDRLTVSVWNGCITTVKTEGLTGRISVVSPDNENLSPKGTLAQAIAIDTFGKDDYPDQKKLLSKFKDQKLPTCKAIMGKGTEAYDICHVVGPIKSSTLKEGNAMNSLISAYSNAFLESILSDNQVESCQISDDQVESCQINVPLVSAGSYGFTPSESIKCFVCAVEILKDIIDILQSSDDDALEELTDILLLSNADSLEELKDILQLSNADALKKLKDILESGDADALKKLKGILESGDVRAFERLKGKLNSNKEIYVNLVIHQDFDKNGTDTNLAIQMLTEAFPKKKNLDNLPENSSNELKIEAE